MTSPDRNPFYEPLAYNSYPQPLSVDIMLRALGAFPSVSSTVPSTKGWVPPSNRGQGVARIDVADPDSVVQTVNSAEPGSTLYFHPKVFKNPVGLGNGITLPCDGLKLDFAPGAEIQVATWGQPGIDGIGRSDTTIDGGLVRYVGTRGDHLGNSGRAGALYTMCAGAWFNKDRNTVRNFRTVGMPIMVFFSGWDGLTATDYKGFRNRVLHSEAEGGDWGVLWAAQKSFLVDGLYFHDDVDDSSGSNPTHAIYCSSTDTWRSSGVVLNNLITERCLGGQPYQIKYADDVLMSNLAAVNSSGLYNCIGCEDLVMNGASAVGCVPNLSAPAGVITVQNGGAARHQYKNIAITADMTNGYNQRMFLVGADDSIIDGVTIISKRFSDANNPIACVRGDRNITRNMVIKEIGGIVAPPALFIGSSGVSTLNNDISDLKVSGCSRAVDLYGPASGIVRYYKRQMSLTTATYVLAVSGAPDFEIYQDGVKL